MNTISDLYGAFSVEFKMKWEKLLIHIIPEMAPATVGLKPLGSYSYTASIRSVDQ